MEMTGTGSIKLVHCFLQGTMASLSDVGSETPFPDAYDHSCAALTSSEWTVGARVHKGPCGDHRAGRA